MGGEGGREGGWEGGRTGRLVADMGVNRKKSTAALAVCGWSFVYEKASRPWCYLHLYLVV